MNQRTRKTVYERHYDGDRPGHLIQEKKYYNDEKEKGFRNDDSFEEIGGMSLIFVHHLKGKRSLQILCATSQCLI